MDEDGVSPVVGTILLIAATVAIVTVVFTLVSGLYGPALRPTIAVWSSFENKFISRERSYVTVNDELRIEFSNFSENSPIEYKIVLVYDGNTDNIAENRIYSTFGIVEINCSGIGELRISANGISRAVEVVSPFEYDMKEIEENALRAQERAVTAQWITIIVAVISIATTVIFPIVYYRKKTKHTKSRKSRPACFQVK